MTGAVPVASWPWFSSSSSGSVSELSPNRLSCESSPDITSKSDSESVSVSVVAVAVGEMKIASRERSERGKKFKELLRALVHDVIAIAQLS